MFASFIKFVLWNPIFWLVKFFIFHLPKWVGGYGGMSEIDICSNISTISTGTLFGWTEQTRTSVCDEIISKNISSSTVLLMFVLAIWAMRELIPLVVRSVSAYFSRLDRLKNEQITKGRYLQSSIKSKETKEFNTEISDFAKKVIMALQTDFDEKGKFLLVLNAYQALTDTTKARLGYSTNNLLKNE